jgi:hypothetical protein
MIVGCAVISVGGFCLVGRDFINVGELEGQMNKKKHLQLRLKVL